MKNIYSLLFVIIIFLIFGNISTVFLSFALCEEEVIENATNIESDEKAKGLALFGLSVILFVVYMKCIKTGSGCDFDPGIFKETITSYFDTMINGERNELGYTVAEQKEMIKKAEKEMYSSLDAFEKSIQNMDPELRKKWIYIKTH